MGHNNRLTLKDNAELTNIPQQPLLASSAPALGRQSRADTVVTSPTQRPVCAVALPLNIRSSLMQPHLLSTRCMLLVLQVQLPTATAPVLCRETVRCTMLGCTCASLVYSLVIAAKDKCSGTYALLDDDSKSQGHNTARKGKTKH